MMLEVSSAVAESMRKQVVEQLGARFDELSFDVKTVHRKLVELEADISLVHDRLDGIEVDVRDGQKHWSRVSRQQMLDKAKVERVEKKQASVDQRLSNLEKGQRS